MAIAKPNFQPGSQSGIAPRTWTLSTMLALIFLAALVLPSVSFIAHGLVTAWLIYPVWFMVILFERPGIIGQMLAVARRRRFELVMFAGWLAVVLANAVLGRGYAGVVQSQAVITIAMIVVMDLAYTALGQAWRNTLFTALFILLGLEVTRSLPELWSQSTVVREVMIQGGSSAIYASAFLSGVGEYQFYTGCAIISPVLLAMTLGTTGWRRFILLVAWVAIMLSLLLSTLMGAVLLAVGGFAALGLLAIAASHQKVRLVGLFIFFAVMAAIAWVTVLSGTEQGQFLWGKLERQSTSVLEYGLVEGDLTNRAELWENSADTFLENPLFGIGPSAGTDNPYMGYKVGGHSSWLDLPAEYGLVGSFFYLGFVLSACRRALVYFKRNRNSLMAQARLVTCVLFLVGGAYNPVIFFATINVFVYLIALGGLPQEAATSQPIAAETPRRLVLRR